MKGFVIGILAIWNYIRNSWEGEDGKFSYKRTTQFIFVWLMVYMIMKDKVQTRWNFYAFLTLAVLFGLTATIITVPQLIKMMKYYSKSKRGGMDFDDTDIGRREDGDDIPPGQLPT